jgi:hypothetical protein
LNWDIDGLEREVSISDRPVAGSVLPHGLVSAGWQDWGRAPAGDVPMRHGDDEAAINQPH